MSEGEGLTNTCQGGGGLGLGLGLAVPRGYGLRLRTTFKGEAKPKPDDAPSLLTNHVPFTIISNTHFYNIFRYMFT